MENCQKKFLESISNIEKLSSKLKEVFLEFSERPKQEILENINEIYSQIIVETEDLDKNVKQALLEVVNSSITIKASKEKNGFKL